jgi:hypothetical protein
MVVIQYDEHHCGRADNCPSNVTNLHSMTVNMNSLRNTQEEHFIRRIPGFARMSFRKSGMSFKVLFKEQV